MGAGIGNLLGGFAQGYLQAKQMKQQQEDAKAERDARVKLYDIQLKREQAAAASEDQKTAARNQLFGMLNGGTPVQSATPQDGIGPVPGPKPAMSLTDLLADPKAATLLLQSGLGSFKDLTEAQGQSGNQALLRQIAGGGNIDPGMSAPGGANRSGGMGGFEVSGIKLDSSGNPMIDLSRRGEVNRWMVSSDGRTQVGVDKMGRPIVSMPAGPADRAPEDRPMTPDELSNMRDAQGRMLPPGTTLRQAQQMGATTAPKPAEADKKAMMLLKGMNDAEQSIAGLSGADTSSIGNTALNSNPLTRVLTSTDYRTYESTAKRWAQNYLYLKSGAQASEKEVDTTFKTFWPQPGDSDVVKKHKEIMRQQEAQNVASTYTPGAGQGGPKTLTYDPATGTFK